MIKCSFCQRIKEEKEFIKDCTQPNGYHQRCIVCENVIKILKTRIKTNTPEQNIKLLLKLYIDYYQFPTQLYRLFNCSVTDIYEVLKQYNIRRCKNCQKLLTFDDFYKQKTSEDGYNRWCKSCAKNRSNLSMKKSYLNNPINKQNKNHNWRINNLDRHRTMMREHYYQNKDQYRHNNRKRQILKKSAIPPWADFNKIAKIYEEARILELLDGIPRHVDHIIPLQHSLVCGLHVENNLQILTAEENLHKSNSFSPYLEK